MADGAFSGGSPFVSVVRVERSQERKFGGRETHTRTHTQTHTHTHRHTRTHTHTQPPPLSPAFSVFVCLSLPLYSPLSFSLFVSLSLFRSLVISLALRDLLRQNCEAGRFYPGRTGGLPGSTQVEPGLARFYPGRTGGLSGSTQVEPGGGVQPGTGNNRSEVELLSAELRGGPVLPGYNRGGARFYPGRTRWGGGLPC